MYVRSPRSWTKGNVVIANQELDPLRQPGRLLRRLLDFHMLNSNFLSSGSKKGVLLTILYLIVRYVLLSSVHTTIHIGIWSLRCWCWLKFRDRVSYCCKFIVNLQEIYNESTNTRSRTQHDWYGISCNSQAEGQRISHHIMQQMGFINPKWLEKPCPSNIPQPKHQP